MKDITLEALLEAGCHFGHQVSRQNPKAREFIFEARDNIHIIDLAKTKEGLDKAAEFVRDLGEKNGSLIIVGTKRQAQAIIEEEATRAIDAIEKHEYKDSANKKEATLYFVTKRWIGGTLTNFKEVEKNFKKLKDLTALLQTPSRKAGYTKKELGLFDRERSKLDSFYCGIKDMKKAPSALFIVDTHMEYLAVREALELSIPTVGIVDTNADPRIINYPIPANDDAVGSLKIIISHLMDAWIEGKTAEKVEKKAEVKKEEVKETPKKEAKKA